MRVGFRQIVQAVFDNPRAGHPEWPALKNARTTPAAAAWPDRFALYGASTARVWQPPSHGRPACLDECALRSGGTRPAGAMRELEMVLHQRRVPDVPHHVTQRTSGKTIARVCRGAGIAGRPYAVVPGPPQHRRGDHTDGLPPVPRHPTGSTERFHAASLCRAAFVGTVRVLRTREPYPNQIGLAQKREAIAHPDFARSICLRSRVP